MEGWSFELGIIKSMQKATFHQHQDSSWEKPLGSLVWPSPCPENQSRETTMLQNIVLGADTSVYNGHVQSKGKHHRWNT